MGKGGGGGEGSLPSPHRYPPPEIVRRSFDSSGLLHCLKDPASGPSMGYIMTTKLSVPYIVVVVVFLVRGSRRYFGREGLYTDVILLFLFSVLVQMRRFQYKVS